MYSTPSGSRQMNRDGKITRQSRRFLAQWENSQKIEQAEFRLPVYLIVNEHHSQGHFQKGVQTQTKQLKWQLVRRGP